MRKYISVLLLVVFLVSFGAFGTQKKVQAFDPVTIALGVGVSFTAFTGFAQLMAVNGYHMQLSDVAAYFTDTFYEKMNDNYVAKEGKIGALEKFSYFVSSALSGNPVLDKTALKEALHNDVFNSVPVSGEYPVITHGQLQGSFSFSDLEEGSYFINFDMDYTDYSGKLQTALPYQGGINPIGITQYFRPPLREVLIDGVVRYGQNYSYDNMNFAITFLSPTKMRITTPDGVSGELPVGTRLYPYLDLDSNLITFDVYSRVSQFVYGKTGSLSLPFVPPYVFKDVMLYAPAVPFPDSYAGKNEEDKDESKVMVPPIGFGSALNGLGITVDDLPDALETNAELQRRILERLNGLDAVADDDIPAVLPVIGDDGVITFPDDVPANPDVPVPDGGILGILSSIWAFLKSLPGLMVDAFSSIFSSVVGAITSVYNAVVSLPGSIADWWTVTVFPALSSFWDSVTGGISDIVDAVISVPAAIGALFVPADFAIADYVQPIKLQWDAKFAPITAPLKALSFHEVELQDVYLDLNFPGVPTKRYKVIDYSHLKSVRDSVKSLIRAFFWILIIFFNINQLYRLIRGTDLFNTYNAKVEQAFADQQKALKKSKGGK